VHVEAPIIIIGAGLAGCEAAWQLLNKGYSVVLYEMKPEKFSPAHRSSSLAEAFPGAQVREVVVARDLLTPAWADALHGNDAGGHGAILSSRAGFEGLILLERLGAETLDISQAYPQVEAALLEERLQQAFDIWLGKAIDASVVLVSGRLMHKQDDEDLTPEPAAEPDGEMPAEDGAQQNIASGNETG